MNSDAFDKENLNIDNPNKDGSVKDNLDSDMLEDNSIHARIQKEVRCLYQNSEQEGLSAFMPLIKEITSAVIPYTTSGRNEVQIIFQNLQKAVEAYKHTDMIGMADCLAIIEENLYECSI